MWGSGVLSHILTKFVSFLTQVYILIQIRILHVNQEPSYHWQAFQVLFVRSVLRALAKKSFLKILSKQLVWHSLCTQLLKILFTADKDAKFGDVYFQISRTKKRLIRLTVKSYKNTGTYVFLKLFKKVDREYELQQRITLTLDEFEFCQKVTKKYALLL